MAWRFGAILMICLLNLGACKPVQHTRGNFIDPEDLNKIEINKTTKQEVRALLGPPSSSELFGRDVWYYIGDKTETKSFFDPKIKEVLLLEVVFDKNGKVTSYGMKDEKDRHAVTFKKGSTPVKGKDPSLVSELFGNIGRYSAPKRTAVNKY